MDLQVVTLVNAVSFIMGFSAVDALGLTAPLLFLPFLAALSATWFTDRTQQGSFIIISLDTVDGIGYDLLATVKTARAS